MRDLGDSPDYLRLPCADRRNVIIDLIYQLQELGHIHDIQITDPLISAFSIYFEYLFAPGHTVDIIIEPGTQTTETTANMFICGQSGCTIC
jgi:hypothetical protein